MRETTARALLAFAAVQPSEYLKRRKAPERHRCAPGDGAKGLKKGETSAIDTLALHDVEQILP